MSDKEQLKILALKDVISRDKVQYEDQIADLRVALTETSNAFEQEKAKNQELTDQLAQYVAAEQDVQTDENEVVQGELVPEKSKRSRKTS